MEALRLVLVVIAFLVVLLLVWRFTMFRNVGAQGLMRRLPADGVHGWRHGVVRYSGEELKFYKLRSLAFSYDVSLTRRRIQIVGFRDLTAAELEIMPEVSHVVVLSTPDGDLEFAAARHATMALVSWIEAAPNERQIRTDMKVMEQRAGRGRSLY